MVTISYSLIITTTRIPSRIITFKHIDIKWTMIAIDMLQILR